MESDLCDVLSDFRGLILFVGGRIGICSVVIGDYDSEESLLMLVDFSELEGRLYGHGERGKKKEIRVRVY